jgi:hypothetical protein
MPLKISEMSLKINYFFMEMTYFWVLKGFQKAANPAGARHATEQALFNPMESDARS